MPITIDDIKRIASKRFSSEAEQDLVAMTTGVTLENVRRAGYAIAQGKLETVLKPGMDPSDLSKVVGLCKETPDSIMATIQESYNEAVKMWEAEATKLAQLFIDEIRRQAGSGEPPAPMP